MSRDSKTCKICGNSMVLQAQMFQIVDLSKIWHIRIESGL